MADPVMFDDGGSTRIMQLRGTAATGIMDGLLDVKKVAGQPDESEGKAAGPFSDIDIVFLGLTGAAIKATKPTTAPLHMGVNDTFTISSGNGQTVKGRILAGGDCEIKVQGGAGNKPIVEATNAGPQRRYVISNAERIDRVEVKAAGPTQNFIVPPGTIYTTVILT